LCCRLKLLTLRQANFIQIMNIIEQAFFAHQAALGSLNDRLGDIQACGQALIESLATGGKILVCGNGGSAADAQHLAAELTGRFETSRRALPAIALTTDTSALTAIGNDFGFEQIFARQLQALAKPGDCLVAISTSGNSQNVLNAVKAAKDLGLVCVGLLGRDGGLLKPLCDHSVTVGHAQTARIQECHLLVEHIWCAMIDARYTDS